jgi:hypothetical protein
MITPVSGMRDVKPGAGIMVRASNGEIKRVVVTAAGGSLPGDLSGGGTIWTSKSSLTPPRSYTVVAAAVDASGEDHGDQLVPDADSAQDVPRHGS